MASIALRFKKIFGNVRILATDPNYYFISQKTTTVTSADGAPSPPSPPRVSTVEDVFAAAEKAGLYNVCNDVLLNDVGQSFIHLDFDHPECALFACRATTTG